MLISLRRSLAVGSAAVIALFGLPAVPSAVAAPTAADATKAANYLVRNLPSARTDVALAATTALGLAATNNCTYAPSLRTLASGLAGRARTYVTGQPARAAKLAITVSALGLNPRSFGKVNLVSAITRKLPADGRVGSSDSAFAQALAIIALKRARATIPVTLLTKLLSLQDASGSFGYEWPAGTFVADPDTTALAIVALHGLGHLDPQVASAVAAAKATQKSEGYWESFSPVDSTSLMGSALAAAGEDTTAASAWLATQQRPDGGFAAELGGSSSDVMATSEAMFLATGKTMLDASIKLGACPKNPRKLPPSTASCTGVWVVVDRGNGQETVRCATRYATGLEALRSAGFAVGTDTSGFVNRIHGFPMVLDPTFSTYWGYWQAKPKADGTWEDWTSSMVGAATSKPVKGSVEGWYYGPFAETASFVKPPLGYSASETPTITGTPKVGQSLTAVPGTWTPAPTFSYRWYRSGAAISGATKPTYRLTRYDLGKVITVKVTARLSGYQTVSKRSLPTAKVTR